MSMLDKKIFETRVKSRLSVELGSTGTRMIDFANNPRNGKKLTKS